MGLCLRSYDIKDSLLLTLAKISGEFGGKTPLNYCPHPFLLVKHHKSKEVEINRKLLAISFALWLANFLLLCGIHGKLIYEL